MTLTDSIIFWIGQGIAKIIGALVFIVVGTAICYYFSDDRKKEQCMDNAIREDIQDILSWKSSVIRQKNAKELKRAWKEFIKEQELKNAEQRKH